MVYTPTSLCLVAEVSLSSGSTEPVDTHDTPALRADCRRSYSHGLLDEVCVCECVYVCVCVGVSTHVL